MSESQVSWGRPLALATLLVVLGSVVYWLEFNHRPKQEEKEEASKKLFSLKDTTIASIRVVDGGKSFYFQCQDVAAKLCKPGDNSKWELAEPRKLKADDSNVNSLVSSLNNTSSADSIDLTAETPEKRQALLKDYGLSPEARAKAEAKRVEVTMPGGTTRVLYLGEMHPVGENQFALAADSGKADENHVLLVPGYFKTNLEHDLNYWRDKKLFSVGSTQFTAFRLEGTKAQISGEKKDGQWILHPKGQTDVVGDIENIDGILTGATYLTAKSVVTEDKTDATAKKALAGAKKQLTLSMTIPSPGTPAATPSGKPAEAAPAGKSEEIALTLYRKDKTLYATLSNHDPLYELDSGSQERLDKDLKDLRAVKLITSMEKFTAKKLDFEGPALAGGPVHLTIKDNKWYSQPSDKEVDSDKVQALLDRLAGGRIKEFLTGSKIPPGENQGLKLTLGDDRVEVKRQMAFWKSGKQLYARDLLSKRNEAFLLDDTVAPVLPWTQDFFKKGAAPSPVPAPPVGTSQPQAH